MRNRRQALVAAGAIAAGTVLVHEAMAAQVPANEVADRASSIRISRLRTYLVSPA